MIKYLPSILIAFVLISCQSDTDDPSPSNEEGPMTEQMPNNMPSESNVEVSDEELDLFLEASMVAREVQLSYQQEMMEAIEDEDMALEAYTEIAQAVQMGQSPDEIEVSDEDMGKYERATEVIEEIGMEMEEEVADSIEDSGMGMERFQALNQAIQQDPALQQRIQQKLQESGMGPQQQNPQPEPEE